jgi:hypothetical protein
MTSNGYNLSSDNTCNFNSPGDLNNTNPKLGGGWTNNNVYAFGLKKGRK